MKSFTLRQSVKRLYEELAVEPLQHVNKVHIKGNHANIDLKFRFP